jgi:hypothetical protein
MPTRELAPASYCSAILHAAIAGLFIVGGAAAAVAENLIVNGTFSEGVSGCEAGTTTIFGWTVTAGNVDVMDATCSGMAAPRGQTYFLDLTGSHAPAQDDVGTISQTVPTVVGQRYRLTFAFGANPQWQEFDYPNDSPLKAMAVHVNGAIAGVYSAGTKNASVTDAQWSKKTIIFTAKSASATISFTSLNGGETNPSDFGPLLSEVAFGATRGGSGLVESVSATAPPWLQSDNPTLFHFSNEGSGTPVIVPLAPNGFMAGGNLTLQCTGGVINGGGLPNSGCAGLTEFPPGTSNEPGSVAVNASVCFTAQVLATFADANGVVVGQPFCVQPTPGTVTVPAGAVQLQLGINDTYIPDNTTITPFSIAIGNAD